MDTLSHGLWGGIAVGRKSRKDFLLAFLFGIAPDVLSLGFLFTGLFLGIYDRPDFSGPASTSASLGGPPDPSMIPSYIPASL